MLSVRGVAQEYRVWWWWWCRQKIEIKRVPDKVKNRRSRSEHRLACVRNDSAVPVESLKVSLGRLPRTLHASPHSASPPIPAFSSFSLSAVSTSFESRLFLENASKAAPLHTTTTTTITILLVKASQACHQPSHLTAPV